MPQTDLKSDNFCGYNTSAAPMYWRLDPIQNRLQYNIGEVGVPTAVGLNTPGEVIQVDSFLKNIGNHLTSCAPPAPPLPSNLGFESDASIQNNGNTLPIQGAGNPAFPQNNPALNNANEMTFNNEKVLQTLPSERENFSNSYTENQRKLKNDILNARIEENFNSKNINTDRYGKLAKEKYMAADGSIQNFTNMDSQNPEQLTSRIINAGTFLLPDSGQNVKRSANDTSSVDWQAGFAGNGGNLHTNPQNLTYVIERMWEQRGGLDQNDLIKKSWSMNTNENPEGPKNLKGQVEKPTCEKIRRPYPISAPFGLKFNQQSKPFTTTDIVFQGKSSPRFGQHSDLPFNYNAPFINGGCNKISAIDNAKMCSNKDNDLTGTDGFNWKTEIPPLGI